jgi:hypothetical protein
MLKKLGLWFFKVSPYDAKAGANEIAAMAVEEELSVIGSADSNMKNDNK